MHVHLHSSTIVVRFLLCFLGQGTPQLGYDLGVTKSRGMAPLHVGVLLQFLALDWRTRAARCGLFVPLMCSWKSPRCQGLVSLGTPAALTASDHEKQMGEREL